MASCHGIHIQQTIKEDTTTITNNIKSSYSRYLNLYVHARRLTPSGFRLTLPPFSYVREKWRLKGMIEGGGRFIFLLCLKFGWVTHTRRDCGSVPSICIPPPNQVPLDTTVFQLGGRPIVQYLFLKTLLQPLLHTHLRFKYLDYFYNG